MSVAVSVIVPAYNAEKTVEKALQSLIDQTFKNIEIIIIDDGSKDKTREIISSFAAKDTRIKLILKDVNEGLSAARNSGIKMAKGDYIGYLDSDDWCEKDMFEKLYNGANNADVVVSGFYHDSLADDGSLVVQTEDRMTESSSTADKKEIVKWAAKLDSMRIFAFTWNKLYKRDFLQKTGIIFEQQTLIEDYMYNCKIWESIERLSVVEGAYYHYIKFSKDALTQKFLPDYFEIIDKRYVLMRTIFEKENLFEGEMREILCNMHIKHVLAGMVRNFNKQSNYSVKQQKEKIKEMLNHPNCIQAMSYAVGKRKQERICNFIFRTRSVLLNYLFSKTIYKMQNSPNKLFDKLK